MLQIRAMVFGVTIGNGNRVGFAIVCALISLIFPLKTESGGIQMRKLYRYIIPPQRMGTDCRENRFCCKKWKRKSRRQKEAKERAGAYATKPNSPAMNWF